MKISDLFHSLGLRVSQNVEIAIISCLTVIIICSIGISQDDPETLWVNYNGIAYQQQEYFSAKYGQYYRINSMYMKLYDPDAEADIFTKPYLSLLYAIESAIENATIELNGNTYDYTSVCFEAIPEYGCVVTSPLEIWHMNYTALLNDPDVKETATCQKTIFPGNMPCTSRGGYPIELNEVLGNITCVSGALTDSCIPCTPNASALMLTYLFVNNNFTMQIAESWELNVFESIINSVNDQTFNFSQYVNPEDIAQTERVYISYMAQRSIPDELVSQAESNAIIVVLSYLLMFLYIATAIGSFPNKVHSSFLLGLGGIFIVAMSVVSSIGLLSYFGVQLSLISAEVVPFLILAIGVDNMFIIANAYQKLKERNPSRPIHDIVAETMEEVGPSITAAASCEILVFLVGITTGIPSLVTFCVTAAIAVFFDYLFQLLLFVSFLTLDEIRKKENRYDILFWIKDPNAKPPRDFLIKRMIDRYYIPILFSKYCKVIVDIVFLSLIALSLYGYNQLELGLEQQVSVPENSPVYNFFVDNAEIGEIGPEAFVVFKNVDFQNQNDIKTINSMINELAELSCCVVAPVYSWLGGFNSSMSPLPFINALCNSNARASLPFAQALQSYLDISIKSQCCLEYGVCGEQYSQDFAFNEYGEIESSRFRFFHTPLNTQAQFINSYVQVTNTVNKYSDKLETGTMFAYSLFYVYFEQYTYIKGLALSMVLIATAVVYIAILILRNISSALIVYLCVTLTTLDMLGIMWLWNIAEGSYQVQINAVSVVNLITTVGLSVEFSCHIMLKFSRSRGTRLERAKIALSEMGSSVLVGISFTKFLGIMVLGFAPSPIFRLYFFRMYISIIILGSFHGLVFLPLLLSRFGPDNDETIKIQDENHQKAV